MTNLRLHARSGLAAIAAVLALPATSAVAQDAAPATTGPVTLPADPVPSSTVGTPVAAPAPTIALPTVAPAIADPTQVGPTTAATPTRSSVPARSATTRTVAARSVSPALVAAPAATSAPVVNEPVPVTAPFSAEAAPADQAPLPAATVAPAVRDRDDGTETLAEVLAGLLVAGLGIGALAMLLRRRRRTVESEPVIVDDRVAEPVYARSAPVIAEEAPASVAVPTVATEGGLPNDGAAIALPREAPQDFEERSSLLRRMIAARPDKANPFTAPQARAKRARLILASLGRKFERSRPRIDLSEYPNNWPALARRNRSAFA